ncbi:CoA pyrophosphatase [Salinisphaera sp. SPP-AMP-43]|uniref:NUDIX hydrolase n=1 Tax=Salinisphaera sp. SPP-AMP-43 TaxID=3121288 RepID=UPI003C6E6350
MPKSSSPATSRPEGGWRHWIETALALDVPAADQLAARDARSLDSAGRPAGVLIAIEAGPEPLVYFTERSGQLKHHPGQISFPGGRLEERDPDLATAALREAEEEIGLDRRHVALLGPLPRYCTVTGFEISPFVGWVDPAATVVPDGIEVARIFKVPLAYAADAAHYRIHRRLRDGLEYHVYSIDFEGNHIWGATAGMLIGLAQRIALARGEAFTLAGAVQADDF